MASILSSVSNAHTDADNDSSLIDTATGLLAVISADEIRNLAQGSDFRTAIALLLTQNNLQATPFAIDEAVDRVKGDVQVAPE